MRGISLFIISIVDKAFSGSRSYSLRGTFYTTDRSKVFYKDS